VESSIFLAPVLLAAFAMPGCASEPDESQEAAIAAIEKLGGQTTISGGSLVKVSFRGVVLDDAGLAHLASLPKLESLYLPGTGIGDAGLERLKGLPSLVNLYLSGTKVTDAGLGQLEAYPRLRVLALDRTAVSDAGLDRLERLKGLVHLNLSQTNVTEAGVERLRRALPNCKIVHSAAPSAARERGQ
jgi:hypothetical protein